MVESTDREKVLALRAVLLLASKHKADIENGYYYNRKTKEEIPFEEAISIVVGILEEMEDEIDGDF